MPYFKESLIKSLYKEITDPIEESVSLCHACYRHIPALKYEKDGKLCLVKVCPDHGTHHYVIENDIEFINSLYCTYSVPQFNFNHNVLIEASDRCNLNCPHCYHIPDNKIKDIDQNLLINQIYDINFDFKRQNSVLALQLAGAEPTLRNDFNDLVYNIRSEFRGLVLPRVMTNGIRFEDKQFTKESKRNGLDCVCIGLNHPSYNNSDTARKKQEAGIENCLDENLEVGYISYTMQTLEELEDILNEIFIEKKHWTPSMFRIRHGSDIGRNPGQPRIFVSDIFKAVERWCENNEKDFKIIEADNNIYHVMVEIEGKFLRLIQWCDEYDIDMESLRSGPWCNFVPNGITNFLNQIVRRNAWKNKGLILLDRPPLRYQMEISPIKTELNLLEVI